MKEIVITVIVAYALWVALYLLHERISLKRKKQSQPTPNTPAERSAEEDIIVKSTFDLCHSLPDASKAENQKNGTDNPDIFAPSSETKPPARVPDEALDEAFSHRTEDNEPMDIYVPLEYETASGNDAEDFPDEEDESFIYGNAALAEGSSIEEMRAAVRTVVHHKSATLREKEDAGGVLIAMKRTDLFEQVVQSAPGRGDIVDELMHLHVDAYERRLAEEAAAARGSRGRKAPRDFDIKNFI